MAVTLCLTAFDLLNNHKQLSCEQDSLEACFGFLNHYVASGNTLLTTYILDSTGRTDLPVDAFDGIPVSLAFDSMQKEWELILSDLQPAMATHYQDLLALARRHLLYNEQYVACHEQMASWYELWIQQTQNNYFLEPRRTRILERYRLQLEHHQLQLCVVRFRSTLLAKRLNHLSALVA